MEKILKRVIFLDVDGVLNSQKFMHFKEGQTSRHFGVSPDGSEFGFWASMIDPKAVKILNKITDLTGAELVLSSTWRKSFKMIVEMREFFKKVGVTGKMVGMTPTNPDEVRKVLMKYTQLGWVDRVFRGHEIDCHLHVWYYSRTNYRTEFVILDDDSDMAHLMDRLIQTRNDEGLTVHHVAKVCHAFGVPFSIFDHEDLLDDS